MTVLSAYSKAYEMQLIAQSVKDTHETVLALYADSLKGIADSMYDNDADRKLYIDQQLKAQKEDFEYEDNIRAREVQKAWLKLTTSLAPGQVVPMDKTNELKTDNYEMPEDDGLLNQYDGEDAEPVPDKLLENLPVEDLTMLLDYKILRKQEIPAQHEIERKLRYARYESILTGENVDYDKFRNMSKYNCEKAMDEAEKKALTPRQLKMLAEYDKMIEGKSKPDNVLMISREKMITNESKIDKVATPKPTPYQGQDLEL